MRPVKVSVFEIRWMYENNKNFMKLAQVLSDTKSTFYATEFIFKLLNQFWDDDQWKILKLQFFPYMFYMLNSVLYSYYALRRDLRDSPESIARSWKKIVGSIVIL